MSEFFLFTFSRAFLESKQTTSERGRDERKHNSFEHNSHNWINFHKPFAITKLTRPSISLQWHPQQLLSLSQSLPSNLYTLSLTAHAHFHGDCHGKFLLVFSLNRSAHTNLFISLRFLQPIPWFCCVPPTRAPNPSDNNFQDCQSLSFNSQSIFLLHFFSHISQFCKILFFTSQKKRFAGIATGALTGALSQLPHQVSTPLVSVPWCMQEAL